MLNHFPLKFICALLLSLGGVLVIGLQNPLGFLGISMSTLLSLKTDKVFRHHLALITTSLLLLSVIPINTNISEHHILIMGLPLSLIIILSAYLSKKSRIFEIIKFEFQSEIFKTRSAHFYLLTTTVLGIFLIPFYLWHSGAYLNWQFELAPFEVFKLFLGTNFLGIWDELFFINICYVLFRQHFSCLKANLLQALLFTSFLFELGFTGWGPLIIFPFALIQGYTYEKTKSLSFVIAVHLILDLILFLSLVYLNHYL